MTNDVQKNNEKFDFFTELIISFNISSKGYKVNLAVCGILKEQGGRSLPVPLKYNIAKIKDSENRIIKCSPKISKHVDKWIKNNPNKFAEYITNELGIMIYLAKTSNNNKLSILNNNPVDKQ